MKSYDQRRKEWEEAFTKFHFLENRTSQDYLDFIYATATIFRQGAGLTTDHIEDPIHKAFGEVSQNG